MAKNEQKPQGEVKAKAKKEKFFIPSLGRTVEASSAEEAAQIAEKELNQ